ncbi:MAG: hemerythrin domain-containing protein [Actinobacteria bacterium]|nr:hemerythrin domain-containing protein [Actinomycetota bacterium]
MGENVLSLQIREELAHRRSALKSAMSRFELALARPTGGEPDGWLRLTLERLEDLRDRVRDHVRINEADDSFFADMARSRPELNAAIARLSREHAKILENIDSLTSTLVRQLAPGNVDSPDVTGVRARGTDLLLLLIHHRQRSADLAWESVNLDFGSGD